MVPVQAPIATTGRTKTGWTSVSIVVLFFATLWTPLIGMFFGAGRFDSNDENRWLEPRPKLDRDSQHWFDLGPSITAYFHDHFGFRGTLITTQALFKAKLLGVSSSPEVLIGKSGWLFYTGDKSMDNYRGVLPFKDQELAAWVQLFKTRQDWLARRGILTVFAIVPDKQSVYPEFLPSSTRKVRETTRLDEFVEAMRNSPPMPVLDLRRALLDSKPRHSYLYSATDTHWNAWGAYAAYLEIFRAIAMKYPDLKPIPFSETLDVVEYTPGDLAKMLGLGSVWRETMNYPLSPPTLRSTETIDGDVVITQPGAAERHLVMFGDSFSSWLLPYLAQHFKQTVVTQSVALDPVKIDEHKPDVVLFEMVERKLNNPPPQDP